MPGGIRINRSSPLRPCRLFSRVFHFRHDIRDDNAKSTRVDSCGSTCKSHGRPYRCSFFTWSHFWNEFFLDGNSGAASTAITGFHPNRRFINKHLRLNGLLRFDMDKPAFFALDDKLITPSILAKRVSSLPRPTFNPGLNTVPRCRTKMLPPVTNCPAKRFTPKYCGLLSRPLRELPPFFMSHVTFLL